MDQPQPSRGVREGEEAELPVSVEHDGGLYEASWYLLRLPEETMSGPCRCPVSRNRSEQENSTGN